MAGIACQGKISYETKEEAVAAAKASSATYGTRLSAYACPFGAGWHVGRTDRLRRSSKRRR